MIMQIKTLICAHKY